MRFAIAVAILLREAVEGGGSSSFQPKDNRKKNQRLQMQTRLRNILKGQQGTTMERDHDVPSAVLMNSVALDQECFYRSNDEEAEHEHMDAGILSSSCEDGHVCVPDETSIYGGRCVNQRKLQGFDLDNLTFQSYNCVYPDADSEICTYTYCDTCRCLSGTSHYVNRDFSNGRSSNYIKIEICTLDYDDDTSFDKLCFGYSNKYGDANGFYYDNYYCHFELDSKECTANHVGGCSSLDSPWDESCSIDCSNVIRKDPPRGNTCQSSGIDSLFGSLTTCNPDGIPDPVKFQSSLEKGGGISTGAIIGIVVGALAVVAAVVLGIVLYKKNKKKKKKESNGTDSEDGDPTDSESPANTTTTLTMQEDGSVVVEITSKQPDGSTRIEQQVFPDRNAAMAAGHSVPQSSSPVPANGKGWKYDESVLAPIQDATVLPTIYEFQGSKPTADTKVGISLMSQKKQTTGNEVVVVSGISPSSIFAGQGLREGMIIKKINGTPIDSIQLASIIIRDYVGTMTIEAEDVVHAGNSDVQTFEA